MRRYGTIGHVGVSTLGSLGASLALMAAISMTKQRPRAAPTPEQIAAADKRTERQKWNDEVEERKAAKKGDKK